MANLTLFDLDGTLLPIDSDHAFGQYVVGRGWADAAEHTARNDAFYRDYLGGTLDIDAYVDFATSAWRTREKAEIDAALAAFAADVIAPQVTPAARELVERHRAAGDRMAIVTATNDFVTAPIAALFGVPTLIATRLAVAPDGRPTGRIDGTPAFREGKIERVRQWLQADSLAQALAAYDRVTFYSDSGNDLPLMQAVSHPVATNPGPGLADIARERGWPILRLFE